MIGMPSRMSGSGRECSRGHPGGPAVVSRPSWGPGVVGSGRETLPEVREWWKALPEVWAWLGGPP